VEQLFQQKNLIKKLKTGSAHTALPVFQAVYKVFFIQA